jgi:chemotaxis protein CheX
MNEPRTQSPLYEINLPKALDLRAASPLANSLLSSRGGAMRLDASQVETVGAQCLQVILSARQTWERDGVPLTIVNPTTALLSAFADAGLNTEGLIEVEQGK